LGGSYFVEALTDRMEAEAEALIAEIDAQGGMVRAVEEGFPQRRIAASAYRFQREVDAGSRPVVGVNRYAEPAQTAAEAIPTLKIDPEGERRQVARVTALRARR